jgi:hypothetical protein
MKEKRNSVISCTSASGARLSLEASKVCYHKGTLNLIQACVGLFSWIKEDALKMAQAMIETADDYLTGNVYGFYVENADGEEIESCGGYFGDYEKSGCLDNARAIARANTARAEDHIQAQAVD